MSDQKIVDQHWPDSQKMKPNRSRSLFAPIVLIAAGTFFLLANLGLVPEPNWQYAISFWPLLLVFIGLNILVVQARAPGGTVLSLLVSLLAVGAFGYLLFAGPENAAARSLGIPTTTVTGQQEPFLVPADGLESVEIELDLSNYPATVNGLTDSQALLEGSIWASSGLALDIESDGRQASVKLGEQSGFDAFFNPAAWFDETGDRSWRIGINQEVPIDLEVNGGNGASTVDLSNLTLTGLRLDSANGSMVAGLPDGDYDGRINSGNGTLRVTFPAAGRQDIEVDGGNGGLTFLLPEDTPARIEFDKGNGSISVDERFELISGDRDRGVYETDDYSESRDGLLIRVETGNGALRVTKP